MNIREKYTVEATEYRSPEQGAGSWSQLLCKVFLKNEDGTKTEIGSYIRNYRTLYNTWEPFTQDGKEYALCSPHYTGVSVMVLPSCEIIAKEEVKGDGFCPRMLYVPGPQDDSDDDDRDDDNQLTCWDESSMKHLGSFGFVGGCVWGDDSSDKIQFLDLSKISEGIIKRDQRFGYMELPSGLTLKQCVYMSLEENHVRAEITTKKMFTWNQDEFGDETKVKAY